MPSILSLILLTSVSLTQPSAWRFYHPTVAFMFLCFSYYLRTKQLRMFLISNVRDYDLCSGRNNLTTMHCLSSIFYHSLSMYVVCFVMDNFSILSIRTPYINDFLNNNVEYNFLNGSSDHTHSPTITAAREMLIAEFNEFIYQ